MNTTQKLTQAFADQCSYQLIGAAIEVHKQLGPGLLESVYHKCLFQEMKLRSMSFVSNLNVPLDYKGIRTDADLRCDFLVEDCLVIELKAVEALAPVYESQLLTYMHFLQVPKGVLINFNCVNLFHQGQKTMVNQLYRNLKHIDT